MNELPSSESAEFEVDSRGMESIDFSSIPISRLPSGYPDPSSYKGLPATPGSWQDEGNNMLEQRRRARQEKQVQQ